MSKPRLFVWAAFVLSSAAFAREDYRLVPIPIPSGQRTEAIALNARGQALATHCDTAVPARCAAVLWTERGRLVTLLNYSAGAADQFKLNDWGQVAALRSVNPPAQTVAIWSSWDGWHDIATFPQGGATIVALNNLGVVLGESARGAFLAIRALGAQFIPALAGNVTVAGLNDFGVVTGTLSVQCPPNSCLGAVKHAFRWTPWSGLQDLETRSILLSPSSVGLAVNSSGDVAGILFTPSSQHPFLWSERDGMRDLGPALGRLPEFAVVNDRREMIGQYILLGAGIASWFRSEKGGIVDIRTLGGTQTYAYGLNNKGQVVGRSALPGDNPPANAFVWSERDGMTDLGRGRAVAVDDKGLILGEGGPTGLCVWTR